MSYRPETQIPGEINSTEGFSAAFLPYKRLIAIDGRVEKVEKGPGPYFSISLGSGTASHLAVGQDLRKKGPEDDRRVVDGVVRVAEHCVLPPEDTFNLGDWQHGKPAAALFPRGRSVPFVTVTYFSTE